MNQDCIIALFGGLSVRVGSRHIVKFRTRNAAFLLARLALEPQFHQREALIEWLWPDCELAVGRNRLSVTLSELRRTLDDAGTDKSLVVATHDAVRLDSARVTTDVAAWETLLENTHIVAPNEAEAALRAALVTFGGWLLVGYDDDHFAKHERRQNAAFCEAVCRLAGLTAPGDAFVLAQLRRAATFAPHNQTVTRALMSALNDEDALRHYAAFEHLARDENGALPNPQTRQLARQIQERHARRNSDRPLVANAGLNSPTNGDLPAPNNRFFGRDVETNNIVRELALLFEASSEAKSENRTSGRLLTLTGGAGHGKTRLAVEVARRFKFAWEGAVVLVPLAAIREPRRLLDALRIALSLPPLDGDFAWQRVIQALRARPTLLVLDNFEHLIEGGAPLVKKLLREAPDVVCLVTSQHRLGLTGEREIRVTGLPIPAELETAVNQLASNASIQLFLDRARLMRPDLHLNADNAGALGALCRALEGVPLAIELAAARAASLSPAQMLEALEERLKFLRLRVGREDATDTRHQSARAALSWSFQLLPPDLARLLPELSLFRGGWNLQSARAICHAPPGDAPFWWPEAHERLLEFSLIKPSEYGVTPDGEPRFELSETVRQFAAEKLPQKSRRALERRHARYFLELFEEATRARQHSEWSRWLPILARENANLRAAMEWTLRHDKALALRLAAAAWWFWFLNGMLDEGRDWLVRALEASEQTDTGAPPACYASALCGAGFMAWRQGDFANSVRLSTQSLALARASGDRSGIIYSLIPLQLAQLIQSNYDEALASSDECCALCRELNDQYGLAFSLHLAGGIHGERGDADRAWSLQQQSHALFEVVGSREGMAYALFNRGTAERRRGDWEAGVQSCQQSQQIFEELYNPEGVAHARLQGGLALVYGQQFARARSLLLEALDDFERMSLRWAIALALEALAMGEQQNARTDSETDTKNVTEWATQLWSAAQNARAQMGTPIPPADRALFAAFEADLRASLDAPAFEAAWQIGRLLKLEQVAKRARQFLLTAG